MQEQFYFFIHGLGGGMTTAPPSVHPWLDAEITAAKVQSSIFSIPNWSSSVKFGITDYYDHDRLQHAGSQDSKLSCHLPFSSFC